MTCWRLEEKIWKCGWGMLPFKKMMWSHEGRTTRNKGWVESDMWANKWGTLILGNCRQKIWEISEEPLKHHTRTVDSCRCPPEPEHQWKFMANSPYASGFLLLLPTNSLSTSWRSWETKGLVLSLLQSPSFQKIWTEERIGFKFKLSSQIWLLYWTGIFYLAMKPPGPVFFNVIKFLSELSKNIIHGMRKREYI